MAIVNDRDLIERLNKLRAEQQDRVKSTDIVADENLIKRLDDLRAKQVSQQRGPTEEAEQSAVPEGSVFGDVLRTVGSVGSSVLAEPLAGLGGLATLAVTGGDSAKAAGVVESAREALTYTPETAGSQEAMQAIGETLAPIAEGLETVSSASGDTIYEWTGSPALAAAAYSLPTAALELAGIKGIRGVQQLKDVDLRKGQKKALLDPELKFNESVAEVKLNKQGQLVEDKIGKKLVKNNVDPKDVATITKSNPTTKFRMQSMVKTFEEGKGNDILAMSNRTTAEIGESVTRRLQVLQKNRKDLGNRLDSIVKGDLGKTPVNVSNSIAGLNKILKDEGVLPRIRGGELSLPDGWYKGTSFDTKVMAPVRKTIEDAYKLFDIKTTLGKTDLASAHKLKKNLDEFINVAKLQEAGAVPNVMRSITDMRRVINDELAQVDSYGAVNKELSEVISVMDPFNKYLKPGEKWSDAKVSAVTGQAMKNLSSDSAVAVELDYALLALEKTLKNRGIRFLDEPRALIAFRKTLLDNFNIDPTITQTDVGKALGGLAISAAVGNKFGAAHDVGRLVAAGMKKKEAERLAEQRKKTFNMIKMAVRQN
jgi:hypothetical protein